MESLETRQVLAGNVAAELINGVLEIQGDNRPNGIEISGAEELVADTQLLQTGTTSVFLDLELLEEAAGLALSSVDSTGTPFSEDFQVGFPIVPPTNFEFSVDGGFAPVGGSIEHTGTVGFNDDAVVVGNFSIGFDPSRAVGDASGFFVADTFAGLGILFDLSVPGVVEFDAPEVTIADTDLLVSPEFAAFLQGAGVTADLTGADVGDARVDGESATQLQRLVNDGVTSVFLDVDLLAAAANLQVSSIVSNGAPASGDFQVGFPIEPSSDFEFGIGGALDIQGGEIRHTGTVGFNGDSIIVGDFSIGFDASRAGGGNSGFFVADTFAGLGILFDVGAPGVLNFEDPELTIGDADLRVSPEFAAALQSLGLAESDLTGADVGDAQIDAHVVQQFTTDIVVRESRGGRVNGQRSVSFPAEDVRSILVDSRMGNDFIQVTSLNFAGDIAVATGGGILNSVHIDDAVLSGVVSLDGGRFGERLRVTGGWIGSLIADLGQGVDLVTLYDSQVGDLSVTSNSGLLQQVSVTRSTVTGSMNIGLDGLFTWTNVLYSNVNSLNMNTGGGNDLLSVISSDFARDVDVLLNGGWDRVMFLRSQVGGHARLDGGSGRFDSFDSYFSSFGSLETDNFEFGRG